MHEGYTFLPLATALARDLRFLSNWYSHAEPSGSRSLSISATIRTGQITQERFLASLVADSERFAERARQEEPLPDNVIRLSAYRLKKKGH
jgi:hypothetical protein